MTTTTPLIRRFKFGATLLDDPAPNLSPEEALRLYIPNYPALASARLGDPEVTSELIVFPVVKPEVQVKGTTTDLDAAEAALRGWAQAPAPSPATAPLWLKVGAIVGGVLKRDPAPIADAFLIPLA